MRIVVMIPRPLSFASELISASICGSIACDMKDGTKENAHGLAVNPDEFIITRKRKKYKFAKFAGSPICFEHDEWGDSFVPDVAEIGAGTGLFSVAQAAQHPEGK